MNPNTDATAAQVDHRQTAVVGILKAIEYAAEAPHWEAERRWKIGRMARRAARILAGTEEP